MRFTRILMSLLILAVLSGILSLTVVAQSLVSGDVTGIVSNQSSAILHNANLTIKNNGTGQSQSGTSNTAGVYRFSLLPPGSYTVTASAQGFQNISQPVTVAVGQAITLNLQLAVGSAS